MLNELVEWLKRMTVFMILCEMLLSFSPSKSYKRYMKPFVGLILLLRIAVFLVGTVEVDWNSRVSEVFDYYEQSVNSYLETYPVVVEKQESQPSNQEITKVAEIKIRIVDVGGNEGNEGESMD